MARSGRMALLAAGLCMVPLLQAQTYKLRTVGEEDGLTNNFVHAIAQDATGHLWIGTGAGAGRYDGLRVTVFTTADSLVENYVSAIHPAPDGSIWFGHNEGGITRWMNGTFKRVPLNGLANSTINAFVNDGQGGVWVAAQNNGIIHIDAAGKSILSTTAADVLWFELIALPDGDLLAGASDGLHLLHPSTENTLKQLAKLDQVTTAPVPALACSAADARVYVGTDGDGVISFQLEGAMAKNVRPLGADAGLGSLQVKDLVIGESRQLLVATRGNGAYELGLDRSDVTSVLHYHEGNGLGTNDVSAVFLDSENSIWFARFGKGIARLLDRSIIYYAAEEGFAQDVQAIALDGDDAWFGGKGLILHTQRNTMRDIDTLGLGTLPAEENVTAILHDARGTLWAGTQQSGLFHQDATGRFVKVVVATDILGSQIHSLALRGNEVWAASSNGVHVIDSTSVRHFTTENGLLHNKVNQVFADKDGQVWMACNNGGVSVFKDNEIKSFTLTQQGNAYHVNGIAQDAVGTLWFSTYGNGVWHTKGDAFEAVTAAQGLRSDYCYGLAADANGHIWVAHRGGASRIEITTSKVKLYDRHFGIVPDRRMNTVAADARGNIWFGTDGGVVRYDASKDLPSLHPPQISITSVKVFDHEMPAGNIDLAPDIYRLEFDFLGISLKDPAEVTYQYMLEGHDQEWNTVSTTSALYLRVEDGEYTFRVKACDADGRCSEVPATIHITVRRPFWKQPWFTVLCIIAALTSIYSVFRIRENNQIRAKQLLQKALDERTSELMTKKEEIERKNKDITDSITYAQRIQQAILPAQGLLHEQFPHSFIMYQPRDIVSGDFYWFRRFGNKFILACADCTGHGVPGAFMSMIGSMLLREVSADKEVDSPNVLLQRLDSELRTVLHYQGEETSSKDGMDISLCEFDMATKQLRTSGAMQDMVIVRKGVAERLRGTRRSVGGVQYASSELAFDLRVQDLQAGDRVYLFSDGIPDQFGGPAGKKLKVSGLLDLLTELAPLPMDQQAVMMRRRFMEWAGDHEQLDDVLMIGIEV